MYRTYSGWQKERIGFIFGLDSFQSTLIGIAFVLIIIPLFAQASVLLLITGPLALVALAGALIRIDGKVGGEWAYLAVVNRALTFRKANQFRSDPPYRMITPEGDLDPLGTDDDRIDLPGVLSPIRLLARLENGSVIGAAHHRVDDTYTIVARCSTTGLALVGPAQAERRVNGWSSWLAQQCQEGGVIPRIGAYHTVEMSDGEALREWSEQHTAPNAPAGAVQNLQGLFLDGRRKVADHVSHITLTIDAKRCRREIRSAGGGDFGAIEVLLRQAVMVHQTIRSAGVEIEKWLDYDELAGVIRVAFAPEERRNLTARRLKSNATGVPILGLPSSLAGPTSAESQWGVYKHDEYYSITGEIDWPKTPRDASMLAGLLAASSRGRRHLALIYEPIPYREAERKLGMEKTKRQATIAMRHRTGQATPEREKRELQLASEQDQDLAAGHGLLRFVAYVSITVDNSEDLEAAWDEIAADAGQHGMVLRRCSGWQDAAFACASVPLGLGLPGKGLRS